MGYLGVKFFTEEKEDKELVDYVKTFSGTTSDVTENSEKTNETSQISDSEIVKYGLIEDDVVMECRKI